MPINRDSNATVGLNRVRRLMQETMHPNDFAAMYPIVKAAMRVRSGYVQKPATERELVTNLRLLKALRREINTFNNDYPFFF